jgi:hypothetical protein
MTTRERTKIDVLIPHAAWAPGRRESLERLVDDIGSAEIIYSSVREHANVWARRAWEHAANSDASHIAILNDDVRVAPRFVEACTAIARAVPDEVVALHCTATPPPEFRGPWVRSYWLTGPAYMMPRELYAELLAFADDWKEYFAGQVNEDGLAMVWAWGRQRPIWHAIPALAQHDTSVRSTLGYDHHPNRTAAVTWKDRDVDVTDPAYWMLDKDPPVIPCPWMSIAQLRSTYQTHGRSARCAFCEEGPVLMVSERTGRGVCRRCLDMIRETAVSQ